MALLWGTGGSQALPSFAEVRAAHRPSDALLLDRHGTPLQSLRTDFSARRLRWVPLEEMSPALLQAIVLSEDRRFWEHSGIDWSGVARSAWANVWNQRTQGASTLTMQLAGLIDEGLARPAGGRSLAQKLGQAVTASQLEARWKKHQILEAYLNAVPLRGELVGIEGLSQTLFHKHSSGLDALEAAIAAALVRAPNANAARVAERACAVLMLQQRGCMGLHALTEAALLRKGGASLAESLAPHLARQLLKPDGAAEVRSTLDARIQRLAVLTLHQQLSELARRNVEDGAVLVLDNRSGEVLAWVGGSGPGLSDAPQVDGVLARRQPGSTLKPFVYQLAFEQRLLTPASLLEDSPAQIGTSAGLYLPQNYDRRYRGWVSTRQALAGSLNIPAVRAGALLPPESLLRRLKALGLDLPHTGGYYGQALALGSAEVTLLSLSNAYRTLANGGLHAPVRWVAAKQGTGQAQRVLDPAASFLITDILADNAARAATFGLDSALALPGFAAVKTGTSKDLRDNWCVGFSDRFTVGVWVGNASGAPMHDVSGVSGAAPIWRALMLALHEGRPSRAPAPPPGVVSTALRYADSREPPRSEWFLTGTEQSLLHASAQMTQTARRYGITHPRDGSLIALDPDIPPAAQRLLFEGENGTWVLDGQRLGQGSSLSWAPWPGKHTLALQGRDGQVLQRVRFEVRGATVKQVRP